MRRFLTAAIAGALLVALMAPAAGADGHEFDASVRHNINGRSLGLDKALPVDVKITVGGEVLTVIDDFTFKSRIETPLPAGEYLIEVFLSDGDDGTTTGPQLPSMTVGPVDIPAGVSVDLKAQLSAGKTPIIKVKVKA